MKQVICKAFGGVDQLEVQQVDTPFPKAGEVLVRLTSVGMNHADLMARRGEYKIASGDPPFTPGIEGGGIVEMIGDGVDDSLTGKRVVLTPDAPRLAADGRGGTYRTHYICAADQVLVAPFAVPDKQLGALWLPYLTAWGCLIWQQQIQPGQIVAMPAASSSVALAAAQIVRKQGGISVGLTTSPEKIDQLKSLESAMYDHLIITHDSDRNMLPWHRDIKQATDGHGVDVFFDPVASGAYLNTEIKCLAQHGCVWVYGLLGSPDTVDVTPLIRKNAAIRGWALAQLVAAGRKHWEPGCRHILDGFADGSYLQHIDATFKLDDVRRAHERMELGRHVGKLVIEP